MPDRRVQGTRVPAEATRQLWLSPLPHPLPDIHWVPPLPGIQVCLPSFPAMKPGLEGLLGIVYNQGHKSVSSVVFSDEWEMETSRKVSFLSGTERPCVGDERVTSCLLH